MHDYFEPTRNCGKKKVNCFSTYRDGGKETKIQNINSILLCIQLVLKGGVLTYIFNHFSVGQLGQNYKRLQTLETVKIVSVTDFEGDNNTYLSLENIILDIEV